MKDKRAFVLVLVSLLGVGSGGFVPACLAASTASPQAEGQSAAGQSSIAKSIGVIKTIKGAALTLAQASGPEVVVTVLPNARILRLASGDKDLKNATPIRLQDLQVGDTIRARGLPSADGKSISALEIIVITRSAVQAVSDQIREDWQKRGLDGIVASVDTTARTVTILIPRLGEKNRVTVHTTSSTVIRRYAPDSVKFEEARPGTLQEIHVNDQLRARGDHGADGSDFTAVEIVTGTFPYVEGTIKSLDASANTISVQDVLSKKTVQLKVTSDSQLHHVPAEMAQGMAFVLKMAKRQRSAGESAGASPSFVSGANGAPATQSGTARGGNGWGGPSGGTRAGGASAFQRRLDQTPAITLTDLHKGDAVTILATEGATSTGGAVIKLFSGVEPILEAAPNGSQAMMLTPWSLTGAPNGDAANP
jgi:hypothetical protein